MSAQAQLYTKAHTSLQKYCSRLLAERQAAIGCPKLAPRCRRLSQFTRSYSLETAHIDIMPLGGLGQSEPGLEDAATQASGRQVHADHEPTHDNPAARRPLLSVAPMMEWTDVHFRQLARLLSRRTWLWTEMVVDKTILHTQNLDKFLWFPPEQRPLVLQLGGSDPATLAAAAARAVEYGYDEINLNCGCPSDRVAGAGCFGAALMMQPHLVAKCMAAMAEAMEAAAAAETAAAEAEGSGSTAPSPSPSPRSPPPVTVKCRLGVDEVDSYAQLHEFVRVVSEGSPVRHFIVHARKAFLNGLSPHQNRTVPPLRHQWAWALARDFPDLQFSLNGGLLNCHEARSAILTPHPSVPYTRPVLPPSDPRAAAAAVCGDLSAAPDKCISNDAAADNTSSGDCGCSGSSCSSSNRGTEDGSYQGLVIGSNGGGIEGVMIGRGAYNDPWGCLADADRAVYGEPYNPAPSRRWVIKRYREYAESMVGRWAIKSDGHADPSIRTLMRPLLNLFHGEPGCKRWKNAVDELLRAGPSSFGEVLDRSLHLIPDHVLDAAPRTPDLGSLPVFQLDPLLPIPSSRAGQNQAPPGSKKPPRGGAAAGKAVAADADAAVAAPCGCGMEPEADEAEADVADVAMFRGNGNSGATEEDAVTTRGSAEAAGDGAATVEGMSAGGRIGGAGVGAVIGADAAVSSFAVGPGRAALTLVAAAAAAAATSTNVPWGSSDGERQGKGSAQRQRRRGCIVC